VDKRQLVYNLRWAPGPDLDLHQNVKSDPDGIGNNKMPIHSTARIYQQYMGPRNRVGIGWSYLGPPLPRLAELIPGNQFVGSLKV
jgi:hypothetical protein